MRSSNLFLIAAVGSMISAAAATAARVDFNNPKRALGREDDVRIDAQLLNDTLSSNATINVTYQIENLSQSTVAIADKVAETSYDADSQTITFSLGAEVPTGAAMPHLVIVKPGEKRVLTAGALLHVVTPSARTPWTLIPRYVQIRVSLLRDVTPFAQLMEQQRTTTASPALPDELFERWVESSDSVILNSIPVQWKSDSRRGTAESSQPAGAD